MLIRNLSLLGAVAHLLILQGCAELVEVIKQPIAQQITPTDMLKYQSPQQVIDAYQLKGKDCKGIRLSQALPYAGWDINGNYRNTYDVYSRQGFLPHALMENLCFRQNGFFSQIAPSKRQQLAQDPDQVTRRPGLEERMGTFKCVSDSQTWFVSIEPQSAETFDSSRLSKGNKLYGTIIMKTRVIDEATALRQ